MGSAVSRLTAAVGGLTDTLAAPPSRGTAVHMSTNGNHTLNRDDWVHGTPMFVQPIAAFVRAAAMSGAPGVKQGQ